MEWGLKVQDLGFRTDSSGWKIEGLWVQDFLAGREDVGRLPVQLRLLGNLGFGTFERIARKSHLLYNSLLVVYHHVPQVKPHCNCQGPLYPENPIALK